MLVTPHVLQLRKMMAGSNSRNASFTNWPHLPLFLIPSFSSQFRSRRSQREPSASTISGAAPSDPATPTTARTLSSSTTASTAVGSYEGSLSLPSLSSSPSSSLSTSSASPSSPTSYFSPFHAALDSQFAKTTALPPNGGNNTSAIASGLASAHAAALARAQEPSAPTPPRLTRVAADVLRCNTCSAHIAFSAQVVSKGFTGRHGRAFLVSAPQAASTPSCPGLPRSQYLAITDNVAGAAIPSRADCPTEGNLANIMLGRPESRQLVTGAHVVADISCAGCAAKLGWKYVDAREPAQRYKVGKFILETQRVAEFRSWEDVEGGWAAAPDGGVMGRLGASSSSDEHGGDAAARAGSSRASNTAANDADDEEIEFDSEDEDECEDIFAGVWDAQVAKERRREKLARLRRKGLVQ